MRMLAAFLGIASTALVNNPCLGQEQPRLYVTLKTEKQVMSAAFSPNARMLASGGFDQTVTLWEVASGAVRAKFNGHTDTIRAVAFCSDGVTLASGSWDNNIKLWDVFTGKEKLTLKGHNGNVNTVD